MQVTEQQLISAGRKAGLEDERVRAMWIELEANDVPRSRFDLATVGYFFGALLVIGAMGWFMTKAWDSFNGLAVAGLAALYAVLFLITGNTLWKQKQTQIVGGLLVTIAVCMVPLAVFGVERAVGWWPTTDPGSYTRFHPCIHGSWVVMEAATVLASLLALIRYPFPFLTAPAAYALWYMSMDATALLFGKQWTWHDECIISAAFGAVMLLVARFLEGKFELDFSFWGYLFGMLTFWGGLSAMNSNSELSKFIYFLLNVAFVVIGPIIGRRVFVVFGALGAFGYLGHLSYTVFKDSALFPLALTVIGIAVIFAAMKYKAYETTVNNWARETLGKRIAIG